MAYRKNYLNSLIILVLIVVSVSCNKDKAASTTAEGAVQETETVETKQTDDKIILFLGNSITAGYELDPTDAFPSLIQGKIDSLGLSYTTVNAGISGETSAGGLARMDWMLRQKISILVLELGGNDGLRGIDPAATYKNLQAIIDKTKTKYPDCKIIIAGMEAPPNMGKRFTDEFRENYQKLAKANEATLIPFVLESVAGIPSLNLPDGIHPTEIGHKMVAETVWAYLKPLL